MAQVLRRKGSEVLQELIAQGCADTLWVELYTVARQGLVSQGHEHWPVLHRLSRTCGARMMGLLRVQVHVELLQFLGARLPFADALLLRFPVPDDASWCTFLASNLRPDWMIEAASPVGYADWNRPGRAQALRQLGDAGLMAGTG